MVPFAEPSQKSCRRTEGLLPLAWANEFDGHIVTERGIEVLSNQGKLATEEGRQVIGRVGNGCRGTREPHRGIAPKVQDMLRPAEHEGGIGSERPQCSCESHRADLQEAPNGQLSQGGQHPRVDDIGSHHHQRGVSQHIQQTAPRNGSIDPADLLIRRRGSQHMGPAVIFLLPEALSRGR